MDKLTIAEVEKQTEKQTEKKKVVIHQQSLFDHEKLLQEKSDSVVTSATEKVAEKESAVEKQNSYVNSFENMTVADIKREQERKEAEEFAKEKEKLLEKAFEPTKEESLKEEVSKEETQEKGMSIATTIEKPNYDLIDTDRKVVRLHKKERETRSKKSKKHVGLALSVGLAISGIICVTNAVLIDQLSSNFVQIEQSYNINLATYLKNIANLDSAKKGMEFLETYPEEILPPGDAGEKSNWFDRLCNFIAGLFGG